LTEPIVFYPLQVHGSANKLKLITFDADGTLYADGHHFDTDNAMIEHIITLMRSGIEVAIVTAAGYPGQPEKFEMRVQGLLDEFKRLALPESVTKRYRQWATISTFIQLPPSLTDYPQLLP
jgi:IMP and pyridine-specific 5'-nucleotidase